MKNVYKHLLQLRFWGWMRAVKTSRLAELQFFLRRQRIMEVMKHG